MGTHIGYQFPIRMRKQTLPSPLTDHGIGITEILRQEFVEEIEATLARDPDLDKFELETRFSSLNPQKQE